MDGSTSAITQNAVFSRSDTRNAIVPQLNHHNTRQ
jgi:hypothetical protein